MFRSWADEFAHRPTTEADMTQTTHPSKEAVRQFMQQRRIENAPPPSPEEVRRQLGWELKPGANHDCQR